MWLTLAKIKLRSVGDVKLPKNKIESFNPSDFHKIGQNGQKWMKWTKLDKIEKEMDKNG